MEPLNNAAYHEAGHAVAAMLLGFEISAIEALEQRPALIWRPAPNRAEEVCVVLGAGAAAEEMILNQAADLGGSISDEQEVMKRSCLPFVHFIKEAKKLLSDHRKPVLKLAKLIDERIDMAGFHPLTAPGAKLTPHAESATLVTKKELDEFSQSIEAESK
jgi:hypothetical protein